MKLNLEIKYDNVIHVFDFLHFGFYDRIYLENEFIIELIKNHNHSYYFKAFFFQSNHIIVSSIYRSKKELFSAVQNRLKYEFYHVVQY